MRRLKFKKIDAFAQGKAQGNPAGAVYLKPNDKIESEQMLQLARELVGFVTEVAFIQPVQKGDIDFRLTYYSAEREVDFCGHATIAVIYDLIRSDPALREALGIRIETKMGPLSVENCLASEDAVYIEAPTPARRSVSVEMAELANALGTTLDKIDPARPVALVNAGLETLIVPVTGYEACLGISPDLLNLKEACLAHGADIVALFTSEVGDPAHAFHTRVFAPTFGYLEDPATGSANAALGHYWREEGIWDGQPLVIEQGTHREHPNRVCLATRGTSNPKILFGGAATVRIEGEYLLA
jgi:PhzF family phenazine biosynthesis protein